MQSATLAGDFNGDGAVDAADYVLWRKTNGSQESYNTWRTNFGALSPGAAAVAFPSINPAVPEPASTAPLLVAATGWLAIPRYRVAAKNHC